MSSAGLPILCIAGLLLRKLDYESFQASGWAGAKTLSPQSRLRSAPNSSTTSSPSTVWSTQIVDGPIKWSPKFAPSSLPWLLLPASLRTGIEMRLVLKPSSISSKMPSQLPSEQPPLWVVSGCSYHQYRTHSRSRMSQHGACSRALVAQRRLLVRSKVTRGLSGEAKWM